MQLASVTGGQLPPRALGDARQRGPAATTSSSSMEARHDLMSMTVGILGMAFKAESDDRRSSLSYRLKRVLAFRSARVLTTDPYVTDDPDLRAPRRGAGRVRHRGHRCAPLVVRRRAVRRPGRRRVEPPRAGGPGVIPAAVSVVIPAYQRGRGHPARPRPAARRDHHRRRGARRRRRRGGPDGGRRRGARRATTPGCGPWSTPTAGGRPTRSATASTRPARRSSSSPWPTAATTRGSSTRWCAWSSAASWSPRPPATHRAGSRSGARCSRA